MNKEGTIKGTVSVDDLKIRREALAGNVLAYLAETEKLQIQIELIDDLLNGHVITTHAEESAAKERAIKAHADELAKGPNKALDDAITQVERKNGKPKRDTYGLIPGRTYKQSEIASKERWGWTWGRKLSQARQLGYIKTTSTHQPFVYEADALIEWRNMGAPYKKPKVAKVKK